LAIAQALIETNLGNAGTGHRNNPYSIYDNKHKRYRHYNSISEGVESYYDLISSKYLKNSSIDKLLKNFVNINNKRYAIDSRYESKLRKVYFSL
jgi:flagellum-specific peptidoglycan hydrolase FlgJ